jgi:hypothetical protein
LANTSAIFKGAYTKLLTSLGLRLETGQTLRFDDGAAAERIPVSDASGICTLGTFPPVSDEIQTGLISWGGAGAYYSFVNATGVFTVLRSGVGRITGQKITWAGGETVTLTANKAYYIGYSATNTLGTTDYSLVFNNDRAIYEAAMLSAASSMVILFEAWWDGNSLTVTKEDHPYAYPTATSVSQHFVLGDVYTATGGLIGVLNSANRTINSTGADQLSDHGLYSSVPDSSATPLNTDCVFQNGGGNAQRLNRRTFTVSGITTGPAVGATYTNNSSTFTVLYTTLTGVAPNISGTIDTWISTGTNDPLASGNLTRASGVGDNTIAFSAWAYHKVVPMIYLSAGVPTPLTTSGATRFGIYAIYILKDDKNTLTPMSYLAVPSSTTYSGETAAANSIGTGIPSTSQFTINSSILALEPVLSGFVIVDGNGKLIPTTNTNGFVNGVRSFKQSPSTAGQSGAVSTANAVNVSTSITNFTNVLSGADVNVQLALDTINNYSLAIPISSNVTLTKHRVHIVDTSAPRSLTLPTPAAGLWVTVKDATGSADTNNITIVRAAAEKIETVAASYVMSTPLQSLTFISNSVDWFIL